MIIPAIDIKDGVVVRYLQGRLDKKVYSKDPVKTARHWMRQGARLIHVVDLDGAFTGVPRNLDIVKDIVKNIDLPVQFGGGVRTMEAAKKLFDFGVWRVVLGTKAAEDKNFLKKALTDFKQKIIVSLDARDGRILIKGWKAASTSKGMDIFRFARLLKEMGFKQLIYTDVSKDGALKGPNLRDTKKILKQAGIDVIASGGISSLDDILKLKALEKEGLKGVIVGKALYEGKFSLAQALKIA